MSRFTILLAMLAAPVLAHADPEPPVVGGWLELALDSTFYVTDTADTIDLPSQRLAAGAQLDHVAVGLELGFNHPPDEPWRVEIGPTARFEVAASEDRKAELLVEAGVLVSMGLSSHDGQDGGPTLYTLRAGLEGRYWLDRNLAVGGGILGHLLSHSQGMLSELDLGLAGTVRVTAVF